MRKWEMDISTFFGGHRDLSRDHITDLFQNKSVAYL